MNFSEKRKIENKVFSIGDLARQGKVKGGKDPSKYIYGPEYFDCLHDKWSRGEVLGLIGASGVGKTEVVLDMFRGILTNNPTGICVFVSLEMTVQKIAERWFRLTSGNEDLLNRLYVVSNFTEEGKAKCLTTLGISNELKSVKHTLNQEILSFAIDHLHIIESNNSEDHNKMCQKIKDMAVELDSFAILLSQTTKGKSGLGDIPLDADASYSCSQFKWIASYVMTIHQPLIRVKEQCGLNILSWGYYKIRERNKKDRVGVGVNQLLSYDMDTGKLRELNRDEKREFGIWYDKVLELRENEERFKSYAYNMSETVKLPSGETVTVTTTVGGDDEL